MSALSTGRASAPEPIPQRPRIICVDDEPNVLASLQLLLSRQYEVHTAESGQIGLELLTKLGSVPVIISDMRMPGMSGAEFLGEVAQRYPTSSRILLTGATEIEAAAQAINAGNLFRFLLKPCAPNQLRATLQAAIEQNRLLSAEQDLLQRTLLGSIRALTEVLAIADPVAFGRSGRLKQLTVSVASRLGLADLWQLEYAALVCQIGNISLPESTAVKLYSAQTLTVQERIQVEGALKLGPSVIKHIPRLEPVTRILEELASRQAKLSSPISRPAEVLRTVLAYEALERTAKKRSTAVQAFLARRADFDPDAARALLEELGEAVPKHDESIDLTLNRVQPGMVTAAEYRNVMGALLVPSGTEITASLLAKLSNFPTHQLPPYIQIQKG